MWRMCVWERERECEKERDTAGEREYFMLCQVSIKKYLDKFPKLYAASWFVTTSSSILF